MLTSLVFQVEIELTRRAKSAQRVARKVASQMGWSTLTRRWEP